MGQTEVKIFVVLSAVITIVFVTGVILLVFQYRRRKMMHEQEKMVIERQHKVDLLSNQLLTQQQTMEFIGSEIHDSVTQKLSLAAIYSQKLEYENKYPDIRSSLLQVSDIINASLTELRDLSRTLTNAHIQNTGLTELLLTEQERIDGTGLCKLQLDSQFDRPLSFAVRNSLFRVIQEFIQNSVKHSACSLISIALTDEADGLHVLLSDDGRGFDMHLPSSGGIGLNNMKRRIHQIGGTFQLRSSPGAGTALNIVIAHQNLQPQP